MQFNFITALLITMAAGAIAAPTDLVAQIDPNAPADLAERIEAAMIRIGLEESNAIVAREADPNVFKKIGHWLGNHNPFKTQCGGQGTGNGCSGDADYCSCTYITTYQCICV